MSRLCCAVVALSLVSLVMAASVWSDEGDTVKSDTIVQQTKGDIRVSLIEVSNRSVLNPQWKRASAQDETRLIPCGYVAFVVEHLGEAEVLTPKQLSPAVIFSSNGTEITPMKGFVGGMDALYPYREKHAEFGFPLPAVDDARRAHIRKTLRPGIVLPQHRVDVEMRVALDGETEMFQFQDVPLD